ncbi:MAG: phasin family protein [Paracoccaceae bacterium]
MANAKITKSATEQVEAMTADTQKAVTEQVEKLTKGFEGVSAFGQGNVEALVKSSEVAVKAVEGLNSEVSAFSKKSFDESVAAAKDLASAKTVTEMMEKQTAFAQTSMEHFVAQSTKMNELFAAVVKDVTAPWNARVNAATDMMKTFAA